MIPRTLESEVMDTIEDASEYDAMDHSVVNARFVADLLRAAGGRIDGTVLDIGTGTAQIPIELCRVDRSVRVVATDLADQMLLLAARNIEAARLQERVILTRADAKAMTEGSGSYSAVVSNSIIHHIPEPLAALKEMARLVAPGGLVFVRDLIRPDTSEQVEWFVQRYTGRESSRSQSLFRDSLNAALTLDEVRDLVVKTGAEAGSVRMSSNRHWSWVWRKPT